MRYLTAHKIEGGNDVDVAAVDAPAVEGGNNHEYRVSWGEELPNGTKPGFGINFQKGPILQVGNNGITLAALLAIGIDQLQSLQAGPFACRENAVALTGLEQSLMWLQKRTRDRKARGVYGTYQK